MNRRAVGAEYEDRACAYLEEQGFSILARNFRCKTGEIDLVARDGRTLVFVEVKYRRSASAGSPLEAVGLMKQRRITGAARWYMAKEHIPETVSCRFDVVGITPEGITHIRDAFPAAE